MFQTIGKEVDTDDFEYLYKKYSRLLKCIVSKVIFNKDDIEDCLQETFLYVIDHKEKLNNIQEDKIKNYLATICHGFAVNKYRKNQKEIVYDFDSETNEIIPIKENSDINELSLIIDNLSDKDRNFFYLTYIYGYTSEEIASLYGIKSSYVRKRLQISRDYLRRELTDYEQKEKEENK